MAPLSLFSPSPRLTPYPLGCIAQALRDMAATDDGTITCPATGQRFSLGEAERVFVL